LTKYESNSFNENLIEKAYLIGIRYGDLSTQIHGRKIRISVSSTHPAMLRLFKKLFDKYGKVNSYPKCDKKKNRYVTCTYCDLDKSFGFLVPKSSEIPEWISKEDKLFFSFLSGYFDAEGCISIYQNEKYWNMQWILKSCDKRLLENILKKLNELEFTMGFNIAKKADGESYNEDYWYLGTGIKLQVLQLLNYMNLKHDEKISKHNLLKNIIYKKSKFPKHELDELHNKIKTDIKRNMEEARMKYAQLH